MFLMSLMRPQPPRCQMFPPLLSLCCCLFLNHVTPSDISLFFLDIVSSVLCCVAVCSILLNTSSNSAAPLRTQYGCSPSFCWGLCSQHASVLFSQHASVHLSFHESSWLINHSCLTLCLIIVGPFCFRLALTLVLGFIFCGFCFFVCFS